MPLFRKAKPEHEDPIDAFWRWWGQGAAEELNASIEGPHNEQLPTMISGLVAAIDPDLQWETMRGHGAKHALCVTAGGDPALRREAERWLRAAPEPDLTWEYAAARRATADAMEGTLEFGGWEVQLEKTLLGLDVDDDAQQVSVACFNPTFVDMPDQARAQVTYLILDWLLGEDDVERWLGAIEPVTIPPSDGLPAQALPETVVALAARHVEPRWALLSAMNADGFPVMVAARRPLRWIEFPLFDQHIELGVSFDSLDNGLPTPESLLAIRDFEDGLSAHLGDCAVFTAHETSAGTRVLHYYADSEQPTASRVAGQWAEERGALLEISTDPGWSAMRRYG